MTAERGGSNVPDGGGDPGREVADALKKVYRSLSRRARSGWEIRQFMESKGISPQAQEAVLLHLTEQNLLNDEKFARDWVEERKRLKPMGRIRLRHELQEKRIAPAIIEQVLATELPPSEELRLARRALLAKTGDRAPGGDGQRERRALARLQSFLVRRGFPADVIWQALKKGGYVG